MIILPLIGFILSIVFLIPWLNEFVIDQVPLLKSSLIIRFINGSNIATSSDVSNESRNLIDNVISEENIIHPSSSTVLHLSNATINQIYNNAIDHVFIKELLRILNEKILIIKDKVNHIYYNYIPVEISQYLDNLIRKSDPIIEYYLKNREIINNSISIIAIFSISKIIISKINKVKISKKQKNANKTGEYFNIEEIERNYLTTFETIPMCKPNFNSEELLVLKSYQEIKNVDDGNTYDFTISSEISEEDTPSIFGIHKSNANSNSNSKSPSVGSQFESIDIIDTPSQTISKSPSPDDSFEKAEKLLDKELSNLNMQEESEYQPSLSLSPSSLFKKNSNMSFNEIHSSSSKKLIYKNSFGILTSSVESGSEIFADSTSNVTEETVYSDFFPSSPSANKTII